ncbi:MAG TPA: VOC family protein [Phycisphaerae bacterium]|nr:VOC family protein [Phycisphaerae bacterium]
MSEPPPKLALGSIGWADLTVPNAEAVRAFYEAVVGWKSQPVDMKGYKDHMMMPAEGGAAVAGICHQRGVNAAVPPCWLLYFVVADLDENMSKVEATGGKRHGEPRGAKGQGRHQLIQDPAGLCDYLRAPD